MTTLLAIASVISLSGSATYPDCLKRDIKSCSIFKRYEILIADNYEERRHADEIHDQEDQDARKRSRQAREDREYHGEDHDNALPGINPVKIFGKLF